MDAEIMIFGAVAAGVWLFTRSKSGQTAGNPSPLAGLASLFGSGSGSGTNAAQYPSSNATNAINAQTNTNAATSSMSSGGTGAAFGGGPSGAPATSGLSVTVDSLGIPTWRSNGSAPAAASPVADVLKPKPLDPVAQAMTQTAAPPPAPTPAPAYTAPYGQGWRVDANDSAGA